MFRFHDWLNGEELLDFHGKLYGMSAAQRRRRIPEVLELVGLAHRSKEPLKSYSKGKQQRAGLAQALVNDPAIVFLDEPTSALDPLGRLDVRNIIRTLRDQGKTVFLNSHLLSEVETVCDRVAIINRGAVVTIGPVEELLRRELLIELRLGRWGEDIEAVLSRFGTIREVRLGDGHPVVLLELRDEERVAVSIDALVAAGVRIYGAAPHRLSLEDLFVEAVEGDPGRRDG